MRLPFNLHSKLTPDCAIAILVSLLPLIYFFPATRGHLIISPDDGVIFNIPMRVAAANLIRAGYVPLWDPYIFSGMPLFGAAQAGVLFPLNWFYLVFSAPVATNLMMLSSYMLAAFGAYLYARRSGSSIAGAALTSLVWQCSGFLIGQIGHTNILHTAALLPWLLWAIDGYGQTGRRRSGVWLAVIVAIQVFAGHQQTLVYALLVGAAYALVMWRASFQSFSLSLWERGGERACDSRAQVPPLTPPKGRGSSQPRTAYLKSLIFIAAGLLLAAVQILPTLELLHNSMRAEASYDFFTSFSLPRRFLWTFFAPYVVGGGDGQLFRAPYVGPAFYAEYVGYVGLATVALGGLAFVFRRDARTKFWGAIVLVGLVLALGRYAPFGFYRTVYAMPVLNLFRVPARHLMEVEFALAVLAGRGLTAMTAASDRANDRNRPRRWALIAGVVVFALTCLAVTIGRPGTFQLGRSGPVSILRAPELFLPILVAAVSAWVLWFFARGRRGSLLLLLAVIAFDLCLWGQSSGWRVGSPKSDFELWHEPATVRFLREHRSENQGADPYRILTQDQFFDPDKSIGAVATPTPPGAWIPSLQPDVYMMYGVENAAGYDGFGLARYSRLAGDMKVWGDLTDLDRTLRSESRELDLLNVRYLLARSSANDSTPETAEFPAAKEIYGGQQFAEENLNAPSIVAGEQLSFRVTPIEVDHVALLTNLAWSETVPDHEIVARIRLHTLDKHTVRFDLRAGDHTSEWAYDRPDIRSRVKHKRAPVATSYEVVDGQTKYEAHTYVASFALPGKAIIVGGEIVVTRISSAPQLTLSLSRLSLADGKRAFPLRSEWITKAPAASEEQRQPEITLASRRWQRVAEVGKVAIFENSRSLPRAWLVTSELKATEEEELNIIRSGKTPNGEQWNPLEKALVELSSGIDFGAGEQSPKEDRREDRRASVVRHEPNRIEVNTESGAPALLVLSENHYPGWRASVDGKPVEVMRVNYNQRGVALAPGKHLVTFVYRPKSVLIGLVISLLTLAALVVWWSRAR